MDPLQDLSIMFTEWKIRRELRIHYGNYMEIQTEDDNHNLDRMQELADAILCLIHENELLILHSAENFKDK